MYVYFCIQLSKSLCREKLQHVCQKMASLEESSARTEEHSARLTIMVSNVVWEDCVLTWWSLSLSSKGMEKEQLLITMASCSDKIYTGLNIPGFSVWIIWFLCLSAFILYVHLYTHTCNGMLFTYISTHIRAFVCTSVTSNGSNSCCFPL